MLPFSSVLGYTVLVGAEVRVFDLEFQGNPSELETPVTRH